MDNKNLPLIVMSIFCLFLMTLLILNIIENHHYERILVDRAEDVLNDRYDELEKRFNEASSKGLSAFEEIDRILSAEETSTEEVRELLNQMDQRLKEADELLSLLSYGGGE